MEENLVVRDGKIVLGVLNKENLNKILTKFSREMKHAEFLEMLKYQQQISENFVFHNGGGGLTVTL